MAQIPNLGEIDEASGRVGACETDFQFVANVDAFDALHEAALHGRVEDADEGAFVHDAGGMDGKGLADFAAHGDGGDALLHEAFDFAGCVFAFGAVGGDGVEFDVGVRGRGTGA